MKSRLSEYRHVTFRFKAGISEVRRFGPCFSDFQLRFLENINIDSQIGIQVTQDLKIFFLILLLPRTRAHFASTAVWRRPVTDGFELEGSSGMWEVIQDITGNVKWSYLNLKVCGQNRRYLRRSYR